MSLPRFSVILPTRNRMDKLPRAIRSVEQQGVRDFELIVVDDGSNDGTAEYLERARRDNTFPGIPELRVLQTPGSRVDAGDAARQGATGAGQARNQALECARGEFIAFLDDDDLWLPDHLERQGRRLEENPQAGACAAAHVEFDASGAEHKPDLVPLLQHAEPLLYLLTESYVHTMSVLVARRSAFASVGLLDTRFQVCHDFDWCIRLVLSGQALLPPDGPATVRREIPGGLVTRLEDWYREEMQLLDRTFDLDPRPGNDRRQVLAYRNLLFARLALSRGRYGFALKRLAGSFGRSPVAAARIARLRWARNRRRRMAAHEQGYG
jgi:glycosyltransferase involved in cell wall biosynthesis